MRLHTLIGALAATAALLLAGAGVATAAEPDLWACTAEERAEMGIPYGDCYRTGAELDSEGWVDVGDAEGFGDYVQESVAPAWAGGSSGVRRDENGLACFCGGGQF
jgi:hypothetical protein